LLRTLLSLLSLLSPSGVLRRLLLRSVAGYNAVLNGQADELADHSTDPPAATNAVALHRFPRPGVDVDLYWPTRPPRFPRGATLGPATLRLLPALDASAHRRSATDRLVELERGLLECECSSGALSILPRDLVESLGILVVDVGRPVERRRRFVEEASTASAGSRRGTGKSVRVIGGDFGVAVAKSIR
jgi:hypothetical protein